MKGLGVKQFIHLHKGIAAMTGSLLLIVIGLALAIAVGTTRSRLPVGAVFGNLPAGLASSGGMHLVPLSADQVGAVKVSPAQARTSASRFIGVASAPSVSVTTSLGAFTDSGFKRSTLPGKDQLVASNLPAYVVAISGLSLPVTLGSGSVSHELVIVNAATGTVVEGIKFH